MEELERASAQRVRKSKEGIKKREKSKKGEANRKFRRK